MLVGMTALFATERSPGWLPWAPSQYPKRRLSVRSRKVSKPRDLYSVLPMCLSKFKAIRQFKVPILWLRDFTRSYEMTSFRILRRGPGGQWGRWSQASTSPVTTRAVTLTASQFLCITDFQVSLITMDTTLDLASGTKMPQFGLGTWQVGTKHYPLNRC